jgi:3',5'-cyclic AMP phosphodiesterase CpdA
MRILVVTDTHLAPGSAVEVDNWHAVRAFAARAGVALTVHLGDITRDGWSEPSEQAYAASLTAGWPTPLRFLAGNHDIGDNPPGPGVTGTQPLSVDLLADYRALFGADRWTLDAVTPDADWLLVGCNAQLFGTGTAEEAEQWAWLERVLAGADGRPVAVFSHKPLFQDDLHAEPPHIRYVPTDPRRRLIGLLDGTDCRLFVSGHTHQYRERIADRIRHIWVPSASCGAAVCVRHRHGQALPAGKNPCHNKRRRDQKNH